MEITIYEDSDGNPKVQVTERELIGAAEAVAKVYKAIIKELNKVEDS